MTLLEVRSNELRSLIPPLVQMNVLSSATARQTGGRLGLVDDHAAASVGSKDGKILA
jgi:hypothetical protein